MPNLERVKESRIRRLKAPLFYLIIVASLIALLFGSDPHIATKSLAATAVLLFILSAMPDLSPVVRRLLLVVLPAAHLILIRWNPHFSLWASGMSSGSDFALFIAGVPFAAAYVGMNGEIDTEQEEKRGIRISLLRVGLIQLIISIALNLGALWLVRYLYDRLDVPQASRYRTVSASYAASAAFSPLDAVLNLVIVLSGLGYAAYLPYGAGLALLILVTTSLIELLARFSPDRNKKSRGMIEIRGLRPILMRTLILVCLVVGLKFIFAIENELLETSLILLGVSIPLILIRSGAAGLKGALKEHPRFVDQLAPVLCLFSTALFLSTTLRDTPLAALLREAALIMTALPPVFANLAIILMTAGLALFGVHMVLTISVIGSVLDPASFGLTPPSFAILLITSYMVAMNLSPFTAFTIASSEVNGAANPLVPVRHSLPIWISIAFTVSLLLGTVFRSR